jgi:hypothetical protein
MFKKQAEREPTKVNPPRRFYSGIGLHLRFYVHFRFSRARLYTENLKRAGT